MSSAASATLRRLGRRRASGRRLVPCPPRPPRGMRPQRGPRPYAALSAGRVQARVRPCLSPALRAAEGRFPPRPPRPPLIAAVDRTDLPALPQVQQRYSGVRINFSFLDCSLCKVLPRCPRATPAPPPRPRRVTRRRPAGPHGRPGGRQPPPARHGVQKGRLPALDQGHVTTPKPPTPLLLSLRAFPAQALCTPGSRAPAAARPPASERWKAAV